MTVAVQMNILTRSDCAGLGRNKECATLWLGGDVFFIRRICPQTNQAASACPLAGAIPRQPSQARPDGRGSDWPIPLALRLAPSGMGPGVFALQSHLSGPGAFGHQQFAAGPLIGAAGLSPG